MKTVLQWESQERWEDDDYDDDDVGGVNEDGGSDGSDNNDCIISSCVLPLFIYNAYISNRIIIIIHNCNPQKLIDLLEGSVGHVRGSITGER